MATVPITHALAHATRSAHPKHRAFDEPVSRTVAANFRCGTHSSPSKRAEPKTRNELMEPECASHGPRTQVAGGRGSLQRAAFAG